MEFAAFTPDAPAYVGTSPSHKLASRPFHEISLDVQAFPRVAYRRSNQDWSAAPLGEDAPGDGVWIDAFELGGRRYSHWLFDVWPKLHAMKALGALDGAQVIVNDCGAALRSATLAPLGLDAGRVRLVDTSGVEVAAERALRIGPCREILYTPPWIIDAVRSSFLPKATPARGRRRLYITRAGAERRRVVNEAAVRELAEAHGFETVALETLSLADTAALMSEAEAVLAPHGAGLANIVFCPPGCRVVEFFSHHISPEYWLLAARMGLDYACVECAAPDGSYLHQLSDRAQRDRALCNPVDIVADLQRIGSVL
jgi:capsular polysaccharide biosynthesis protein